jgi:hypothetical protein
MWVVPTYGRPDRCQDLLDSITAVGCATPGLVVVDGDGSEAYRSLRLPNGWQIERLLDKRRGLLATLNHVFETHRDEPWYGFLNDDFIVHTPGWDRTLIAAAGSRGMANSNDGWQGNKRMCGALVFGGELLRALGWWAPPGLWHCFADDIWEAIGREVNNWKYCGNVLVEHRHHLNGRAANDATYAVGYAKFADDEKVHDAFVAKDLQPAIIRVRALFAPDIAEGARALQYARSRKLMIATPIAREVAPQHYLSMIETVGELERIGLSYAVQTVIGSSNLPRARNELCARFLASNCTDLLFIDDDIRFSPTAVLRLLSSEQAFIAGVGRKRSDVPTTDLGSWCTHFLPGSDGALVSDGRNGIEVMRVGTGFLKLKREVFETLIKANPDWKRPGRHDMPEKVRANYYRFFAFAEDNDEMGEDYVFCDRWRAEGGRIWIDPSLDLGHIGTKEFGGAIAELMSSRPQDDAMIAA